MKIIECPGMIGIKNFIPTELKIKYINTLLRVGFDIIDFGTFISPKNVPQMKDMNKIIKGLYLSDTNTELLCMVNNQKEIKKICKFDEIKYVGFPFSVSETFLKLNMNSTIEKSLNKLSDIVDMSINYNKKILVYLSMGFGNPYGDEWDIDIILDIIDILVDIGIKDINIVDTIGVSTPNSIKKTFNEAIKEFPFINYGIHLYTQKNDWYKKIEYAYNSGVRRFNSIIGGYGGCPIMGYKSINNIKTKNILDFCYDKDIETGINKEWYKKSKEIFIKIFENYK